MLARCSQFGATSTECGRRPIQRHIRRCIPMIRVGSVDHCNVLQERRHKEGYTTSAEAWICRKGSLAQDQNLPIRWPPF